MPRVFPNDDAEPQVGLPPPLIAGLFTDVPGSAGIDKLTYPACPAGYSDDDSRFVTILADKLRILEKGVNVDVTLSGTITHEWSQDKEDDTVLNSSGGQPQCISKVTSHREEAIDDGSFEFNFSAPLDEDGDPVTSGAVCALIRCFIPPDTGDIVGSRFVPLDTADDVVRSINVKVARDEVIVDCPANCTAGNCHCRAADAAVDTDVDAVVTISCTTINLRTYMCFDGLVCKIALYCEMLVTASKASPASSPLGVGGSGRLSIYSGDWGDWISSGDCSDDPDDANWSSEMSAGSFLGIALNARYCQFATGSDNNMDLNVTTGTIPACGVSSLGAYHDTQRTGTVKIVFDDITFADA